MAWRAVTPLTPGRGNYGPAVGKISQILTGPPMPWQSYAGALATELLGGKWAYRTLVFSVPRQSGKTTVRGALSVHRGLVKPMSRCWLTAQTRQDARDILIDDVAPRFERSPLTRLARVRRSQGSEGLYWKHGGFWRVFAPDSDAMHGKANELVDVDEAFSFTAEQGASIEAGALPTFTTTGGQLGIVSTAGHAGSVWLRGYVDSGHDAVAADQRAGLAIIDIGLTDEQAAQARAGLEAEPHSPPWSAAIELLAREHPAYGYTLQPEVIEQYALTPRVTVDAVLRAYGNVWTTAEASAFPLELWADLGSEAPARPDRVGIGFDVTPDGGVSAVVAAWRDRDGNAWVEIVDQAKGADWVPARAAGLARRYRTKVGYEAAGMATLAVADQIARAHRAAQLQGLSLREYGAACSTFSAAVYARTLRHTRQPDLDDAVKIAITKPAGDAGFTFTRRSPGSIAALVAGVVALRVYDDLPPARGRILSAAPS